MLEIKHEILERLLLIFIGCLIAAAFLGFSLLKFYEEFRKGVQQNSRLRMWSALFGLSFVVLFFFFVLRIL